MWKSSSTCHKLRESMERVLEEEGEKKVKGKLLLQVESIKVRRPNVSSPNYDCLDRQT